MAGRGRASVQALPVLDRRGWRIGSVRSVGTDHIEVGRVPGPTLRVPFGSVRRLDAEGVHLDAVVSELPRGTVDPRDPPPRSRRSTIGQVPSRDPERWRGGPPAVPQQDPPATGD